MLEALDRSGGEALAGALPVSRPGADDSIAVLRKSRTTGWWAVAEVSDREAMHAHRMMLAKILAMMGAPPSPSAWACKG